MSDTGLTSSAEEAAAAVRRADSPDHWNLEHGRWCARLQGIESKPGIILNAKHRWCAEKFNRTSHSVTPAGAYLTRQ